MSLRNNELKYKLPEKAFTFHAFRPKAVNESRVSGACNGRSSGLLAVQTFPSRLCATVVV